MTVPKLTIKVQKWASWDFPGGPIVKDLVSSTGGPDLIPGQGPKLPHASQFSLVQFSRSVVSDSL